MENLLLAVPIWVSSCPTATIFRRACELSFVECHTGAICGWWTPLLFSLLGDSIKPAIPNMDEFEDEEILDEVYASNGSKPAPDYSRPKRSKRSKQKRAV
ncbi:hypothetical protein ACSBR1_017031 [Camellia fascicularis]